MSELRDQADEPAEGGPRGRVVAEVALTPAARLAAYVRGGGVVVPLLTALLAFFDRRPRRAR